MANAERTRPRAIEVQQFMLQLFSAFLQIQISHRTPTPRPCIPYLNTLIRHSQADAEVKVAEADEEVKAAEAEVKSKEEALAEIERQRKDLEDEEQRLKDELDKAQDEASNKQDQKDDIEYENSPLLKEVNQAKEEVGCHLLPICKYIIQRTNRAQEPVFHFTSTKPMRNHPPSQLKEAQEKLASEKSALAEATDKVTSMKAKIAELEAISGEEGAKAEVFTAQLKSAKEALNVAEEELSLETAKVSYNCLQNSLQNLYCTTSSLPLQDSCHTWKPLTPGQPLREHRG